MAKECALVCGWSATGAVGPRRARRRAPCCCSLPWTIEEIFSAGDRVVVRWTGTGTHFGEINGVPATGNPIRVDGITTHRMSSGKIAETWQVWDTLSLLQQIGVIPTS